MKKVKQKTTEQLGDEIMQLLNGQKTSNSLITLIETTVGVANFMEIKGTDLIRFVLAEQKLYEIKEESND